MKPSIPAVTKTIAGVLAPERDEDRLVRGYRSRASVLRVIAEAHRTMTPEFLASETAVRIALQFEGLEAAMQGYFWANIFAVRRAILVGECESQSRSRQLGKLGGLPKFVHALS